MNSLVDLIPKGIFRANDIRAIADIELTDEIVSYIGKAYGTYLVNNQAKNVAIGADVRLHSPRIKKAFIDAILSTGVDVVDIGTIPTPVAYFAAFECGVDAATIITASHNPAEYNGFKMGLGLTTLMGAALQEVYQIAISGQYAQGKGVLSERNATEEYLTWMYKNFKFAKKFKVALDPANAAGAIFGERLYTEMGCEVLPLYCEVDGRFPNHHPDPTVLANVKELSELVVAQKADLGLGFDGDADRIGVIDDLGRLIPGDLLTAIFCKEILKENPGAPIVYEVKSSQALEDVVKAEGGQPVMWKVGHSFLKAKMLEINAPLAGEVSGHMFFKDKFFGFDDAFYCGLRMIELLEKTGKKLSELFDELPVFCATPEIHVHCENDTVKFEIAKKAVAYFKSTENVNDLDGARIMYADGWGLVRASNTQPVLVCRFEAKTPERLEEIKTQILTKLKDFGVGEIVSH
jgi:phosphomannomutase/phosphoglucomutase